MRAVEVAAAGRHNVLLVGPASANTEALATCLWSILPAIGSESDDTYHTWSPRVPNPSVPIVQRPFRALSPEISTQQFLGEGRLKTPGELAMAHGGVLFMNRLTDFKRDLLNELCSALDLKSVSLPRLEGPVTFPADVMLVGAVRSCRCGHLGDPRQSCTCTQLAIERHRSRIPAPLLDRIDMHIEVEPSGSVKSFTNTEKASANERVGRARVVQRARQAGSNSEITSSSVRDLCAIDASGAQLLEKAINRLGLAPRSYLRVLKVARTIADLDGDARISRAHLAEASQYRPLDRPVS